MRIEYKGDWNHELILHSICAFANDIDNWGGDIIIGIEEESGMPKLPVNGRLVTGFACDSRVAE